MSPVTSLGQRSRTSWASQPQKSATLSPQPGGKPRKFIRTCGGTGAKKYKVLKFCFSSKVPRLGFFSFCHLQFHLHKSKPRPQAYEEMSHARWQVIEFVSLPPLLFLVKMLNFSLIQNLRLVMRIQFFSFFSLAFIFDDIFQAGMPKGRI